MTRTSFLHRRDEHRTPVIDTASIDHWLSVLSRLMHLPEATRQAVCTELRDHLRDRTRDLMLDGHGEPESVRIAIEELGETASLARKLEAANRPRLRRFVMNSTLVALASGIVVFNVARMSPTNAPPLAQFAPQVDRAEAAAALESATITLNAQASLREAVQLLLDQIKVGVTVNWGEIEFQDIDTNHPMGLEFRNMPVARALDLITQSANIGPAAIDWRVRGGGIELGLRDALDRRESTLASYDISAVLAALQSQYNQQYPAAVQEVVQLIQQMVEADLWRDNGGNTAHLSIVGGKLFVQAPSRIHTRVEWILQQLQDGGLPPKQERNAAILRPGSEVSLAVYGLTVGDDWTQIGDTLDADGNIALPGAGLVHAGGLTLEQLKAAIASKLEAGGLKSPQIRVWPAGDAFSDPIAQAGVVNESIAAASAATP